MTQKRLNELSGYGASVIGAIEQGKYNHSAGITMIIELFKALDMDVTIEIKDIENDDV